MIYQIKNIQQNINLVIIIVILDKTKIKFKTMTEKYTKE